MNSYHIDALEASDELTKQSGTHTRDMHEWSLQEMKKQNNKDENPNLKSNNNRQLHAMLLGHEINKVDQGTYKRQKRLAGTFEKNQIKNKLTKSCTGLT